MSYNIRSYDPSVNPLDVKMQVPGSQNDNLYSLAGEPALNRSEVVGEELKFSSIIANSHKTEVIQDEQVVQRRLTNLLTSITLGSATYYFSVTAAGLMAGSPLSWGLIMGSLAIMLVKDYIKVASDEGFKEVLSDLILGFGGWHLGLLATLSLDVGSAALGFQLMMVPMELLIAGVLYYFHDKK